MQLNITTSILLSTLTISLFYVYYLLYLEPLDNEVFLFKDPFAGEFLSFYFHQSERSMAYKSGQMDHISDMSA